MRSILRVGLRVAEDPKQVASKEEEDESFWQTRIQITQLENYLEKREYRTN